MIKDYKYLILGGGPSGLSVAHGLLAAGCVADELLVIEKEREAGGLCRSEMVDGAPIDVGGGHFLDVRREEVLALLFRFMPRGEWNLFQRVSKIRIRGVEIDYPLEANLWQFPSEIRADYLISIAEAGCVRGDAMPESFAKWIEWKLGRRISDEYMLPYNRKIWGTPLEDLGTYWLYKLPDVSFRQTLLSCLEGRPLGSLPAHGAFLYPKRFGYGEVWRRMGASLGRSMLTDTSVHHIDVASRTVNGRWRGQTIISTIPWTLWKGCSALPSEIEEAIDVLKNAPIDVDYHEATLDTLAHWIYEPDESLPYHRLLVRSNFAPGAKGHWSETNAARSPKTEGVRFHNEFAYPINTLGKPHAIEKILGWGRRNGIVGLGRWGRWEHMNSDAAVAEALQLAAELTRP